MTIALSLREQEMLAAVIKEMGDVPNVDFAKVAAVTGQKYPKNARSAFKRIWDKLRGGPGANSGGDGGTKPARKTSIRATTKKSVGPKKAPRKASTKGPAARRKFKKEESEESEGMIKADPDDGYGDEVVRKSENSDSDEEKNGASMDEDGNYSGNNVPELDEDEAGAYLLGVPLEEYKELAEEAGYRNYAPTPKRLSPSDDDAA